MYRYLTIILKFFFRLMDHNTTINSSVGGVMPKWKDIEISHSKKMEALGQLAGGVAHDFNNVLSIIEGYARLVKKHIDDESPALAMVENILEASRRGTSLTRRLLAFGRQSVVSEKTCDLIKAIRDHEILLKPLLMPKVKILMEVPEENVIVSCDKDLVWQILLNTCINSRDAIQEDTEGIITINVDIADENQSAKYAVITITDNGSGMDDQIAKRAFEPFFTTKEQGKGTGLGLPMIYGLVQQAGGKIDLKTAEGEGTSIIVYLPLSEKKHQVLSDESRSYTELSGKTALIVEDEKELLSLNQQILEDFGMRALTAINGDDALNVQDKFPNDIDVLMTDLIMPGMSGVKVAQLMTSLRPEMAVVYITGYPAEDRRLKELSLPDHAIILSKPVQPIQIKKALEKAIQIKTLHESERLRADMK